MAEVIYSSMTTGRRKKYQLITQILKEENRLFVKKTALYPEGIEHIKQIARNYKILKENLSEKVHICECKLDDSSIEFEYIHGKPFAEEILEAYQETGRGGALEKFGEYKHFLEVCAVGSGHRIFEYSKQFKEIFGVIDFPEAPCIYPGYVDVLPQNIFFDGTQYYMIDYEWVYDVAIPIEYILWRAVHHYYLAIDSGHRDDMEEMFHELGFTKERMALYECMEMNFLNYAYDLLGMANVMDRYVKRTSDIRDVFALENKVADLERMLHECDRRIARDDDYNARCTDYELRISTYINEAERWRQEYERLRNMPIRDHIKQITHKIVKRK